MNVKTVVFKLWPSKNIWTYIAFIYYEKATKLLPLFFDIIFQCQNSCFQIVAVSNYMNLIYSFFLPTEKANTYGPWVASFSSSGLILGGEEISMPETGPILYFYPFFLKLPKILTKRYLSTYVIGVNFFNLMISSNLNSTSPSGLTISSFGMTAKCGFSWVKTFWNVWRSISYEHLRHLTTDNVPWSCNMSLSNSALGYIL